MDWSELAKQVEAGAKLYRIFEEGERVASQLASAERAAQETQNQYIVMQTQLDQTKVELQHVQADVDRIRTATSQDIARQQAVWEATHSRQIEAARSELDSWKAKVADQIQVSQKQAEWYQTQIGQWEGALKKLQDQVAALEQIKASLKSQLQGVV